MPLDTVKSCNCRARGWRQQLILDSYFFFYFEMPTLYWAWRGAGSLKSRWDWRKSEVRGRDLTPDMSLKSAYPRFCKIPQLQGEGLATTAYRCIWTKQVYVSGNKIGVCIRVIIPKMEHSGYSEFHGQMGTLTADCSKLPLESLVQSRVKPLIYHYLSIYPSIHRLSIIYPTFQHDVNIARK